MPLTTARSLLACSQPLRVTTKAQPRSADASTLMVSSVTAVALSFPSIAPPARPFSPPPAPLTALGNDKNALFDPHLAHQLKNGLWPGWGKLHALYLGDILDGNGKITVESNPNGSGMGFTVIRSANSKQIPVTPADCMNASDVLIACLRKHSPADAEHLDLRLLKLVVGYIEFCDNDSELVITALDIELRSCIAALKTGVADHVPGSTPGGLPGPTQRVLDAAHRRLDQVRDVSADAQSLGRRAKTKRSKSKSKSKGKHAQARAQVRLRHRLRRQAHQTCPRPAFPRRPRAVQQLLPWTSLPQGSRQRQLHPHARRQARFRQRPRRRQRG